MPAKTRKDGPIESPLLPKESGVNAAVQSAALNELDVTGTVQVTNPAVVKEEVVSIFNLLYPDFNAGGLRHAFDFFTELYRGAHPDYHPCDTIYHDMQHSLDVTLTATRILGGYQKIHGNLTPQKLLLGIVTALFHDIGYLRKRGDDTHSNGAEYTSTHVSRGAEFMRRHFPGLGFEKFSTTASEIVHLTGYEKNPDQVYTATREDRLIGNMVASADLLAQMADRCYLEKCRDRLFPELVLGTAGQKNKSGPTPNYQSAEELLRQTPDFYRLYVTKRLNQYFEQVYRYANAFFDGKDFYMKNIEKNILHLETLLEKDKLDILRRIPPDNYGLRVFPFDQIQELSDNPPIEEVPVRKN
ncbi:MAG TPA: HD domain-containing protein [Gammaproteobacteria bacterium]